MRGAEGADAQAHASENRRGRAARSAWLIIFVLLGAIIAGIVTLATGAGAQTSLSAKLETSGATHATSFAGTTCSAAYESLHTGTHTKQRDLAIGPLGFPAITATGLTVTDGGTPACTTLTLEGTAKLFGQSAKVLVVGQWASSSAKTPTFTIVFGFAPVSLSDLVAPTGSSFGVSLSHAWLATTTAPTGVSIEPTSLPSANQTFFTGLKGALTVATKGISFAGELTTTGAIGTALTDLHIKKTGIQLSGRLSGSVGTFSTTKAPTVTATLSLSVAVKLTLTPPSWLSFTSKAFKLTISGTSSGNWSVAVTGKATVKLPPSTASTTVSASFTVSGSSGSVSVDLSAHMGKISDAFGLTWLTLTTTNLTWTVSSVTTTATLKANVTLGTASLKATLSLSTSKGVTARLTLTTSKATLSTKNLAKDLGLALPTGTPTVTLKALHLDLKVPKTGSAVVAAEATATLEIASHSFTVSLLVRVDGSAVIVAARTPTKLRLKTLVSGLPATADVSLTDLAVVFSTSPVKLESTSLDTPTKDFFTHLYCKSGTTCTFTADVQKGVTIQAGVGLPPAVTQMVCKLVDPSATPKTTCLNGGVVTIDGHIPLFGSSTFGLKISLPKLDVSSGPVRQLKLSLSISEATSKFTVKASGGMVLVAPSSTTATNGHCPNGVTPPKNTSGTIVDTCLTLTVSGELQAGTTGLSVTISAKLTANTGWKLPSPVTWLTIRKLAVVIGIKVGDTGVGLKFGIAGGFKIGTTTLTVAVLLNITPEPPFLDILGFKVQSVTGINRQDIVDLYHDVTGHTLSASELPPLALKDLLLEYAVTTTSTLGLCKGLHISAALVITSSTNHNWPAGAGTAPTSLTTNTCTAPPNRSTACTGHKSSCLASVLLSIGPAGFVGKGHLTTWSAGPVYVTPTTLDVTITTTKVQIHISAGGKLLNPVTWPSKGATAPEWLRGSITLTVGTQRLHLAASGDIGTLHATISATGSFATLKNPFSNLQGWLTTVKGALETAVTHVKSAMTTVGNTVRGWYTTYVASTGNQVAGDIQGAYSFFSSSGPTSWKKLYAVFAEVTSLISGWNNTANKLKLSFLDITASVVFRAALYGIHVNGWTVCPFGKCVTIIPGFTVPGVCSSGTLKGTPLCTTSTPITAAQEQFANPTVNSHLSSVTLHSPATDKTLVTKLHSVDPAGTTSLSCATFDASYTKNGTTDEGTVGPTTVTVNTLGNTVTVNAPDPTQFKSSTSSTNHSLGTTLSQHTLNSLYSGSNDGTCTLPTKKVTLPSLTLGLKQSSIDEGRTVTASGFAGTGITTVTITWGDGSSSSVTVTATTHTYAASHVYKDEKGSPFTVTASASTASASGASASRVTSTSRKVTVLDRPLQLTTFTVAPTTIKVMQSVTVSGTLTGAPEAGEPVTGAIVWGDGTRTNVTVTATGKFAASHVYDRLTPPGKPTGVDHISVELTETDGTQVSTAATVTIHDVPPTGLVSPTTGGVVANQGTVFTHTGTSVGWDPEVTDVSPAQGFNFAFDWGDGTPTGRATVTAPTPTTPTGKLYTYPVKLGSVNHTFADACLYTVTTTATDDDTLSTTLTTPVVVTAPLGSNPDPPGYWLRQLSTGRPAPPPSGRIPAKTLGCYLEIAQHLSPELGSLTPSAAASILRPGPPPSPPSRVAMLVTQLRRELLTVLLDFANGSWNWTQEIPLAPTPPKGGGQPHEATLQTLVANANQALASGSDTAQALQVALSELRRAQGPELPPSLSWSPSTDGIYSFGTVNATTTVTETFTITNPGPNGKLRPLPPAVAVGLTGSATAFTVTSTTCPAAPVPPSTMPPPAPPARRCTVTVEFTPKTSDKTYDATLTAIAGPGPGIASLVVTGTGDFPPSIAVTFSTTSRTGSCEVNLTLTDFKPTTHYTVTYAVTSSGNVTGPSSYAAGVTTNGSGDFSGAVLGLTATDAISFTIGGVTTPYTDAVC